MGKIKSYIIVLMLSILSAWGVQTTSPKELDDKNKELCKIEGIGKEKANCIIKYLFNDK